MVRAAKPQDHEPIRLAFVNGRPRYVAVVDIAPRPNRRQRTKTFDGLREARAWVEETRVSARAGDVAAPSKITLNELSERWLASRNDVRRVTVHGYRVALKPLLALIGEQKVQHLEHEPHHLDAAVARLANDGGLRGRGLSHRSVQYAVTTLKQVLAYGIQHKIIRSSPAEFVKVPRKQHTAESKDVATWTPEQLRQFVAVADEDVWAHAWRLLASGLRRSEVLGLCWNAIDREAGSAAITQARVAVGKDWVVDAPKSRASRRVVVAESVWPGTKRLLTERYLAAPDKDGFLVLDVLGQPPHPEVFSDAFHRVVKRAGLPTVRPHAVRHSLALAMHRNGVAVADAAALLGHDPMVHLQFYLPRDAAGAVSAADRLGKALAGGH